ncbi:hypothetical protein DSM3645_11357 [Blastopirellula marina DSM 3645]|uniref:Uncharacterized protein n=1 Tax=Blastopirellula marina DSM 3645 TaxID=314230 RepID=A3ZT13_9BACT|nr:hypothetical protein DSM3645_11357 [Blastopirellula marina DSM 3645]
MSGGLDRTATFFRSPGRKFLRWRFFKPREHQPEAQADGFRLAASIEVGIAKRFPSARASG